MATTSKNPKNVSHGTDGNKVPETMSFRPTYELWLLVRTAVHVWEVKNKRPYNNSKFFRDAARRYAEEILNQAA